MYAGKVVELGPTRAVFDEPAHPYSRGLLDAFPSVRGQRTQLTGIPGRPPDLRNLPTGCRFHPRCPVVMPHCSSTEPELYSSGLTQSRCLKHAPHAEAS
jgi:peptide/nickel transport system ATP-binding protein